MGCGGGVVAYCYIHIYRSDIVGGMVFNHEFEVETLTLVHGGLRLYAGYGRFVLRKVIPRYHSTET